ncbi:MAG TPA: glycoside hydrolase family 88 protein, partial [Opitutaceae bacterium]|nr:glycoside hydrolase family 88 protein [Opitutaceae bacterium]
SWAGAYNYALISGNSTRDANNQAAGEVYVRLYQLSGTASDLTNITADVNGMVNSSGSSDWTWIDALNMAMPVFAELGSINNNPAYAEKMYSLYNYTKTSVGGPGLYSQTLHLWSRDATFLGKNIYWSRGNAWVFAAHAKVLETLPTSDPHYLEYLATFQAMAAKLLTLQQSDGFWYANLLNPSQYPTPETSGTAGFTYGLAWGINAGVLDSATYLPAVIKAWNGMVATAVHSNGLLGYVQGQGTQPSSSQPATSNSTADFGVGLFLEAGNQVAKLATASAGAVATPAFSPGGGTFSSAQTVTISTTTGGASIRYTLDGSTPSETTGTLYSVPVTISSTATLKAIAYESGFTDSTISSATYTIGTGGGTVATPTFNPSGGTFSSAQTVRIATTTGGASIRYTLDGSTPSATVGTLYSGPISISGTATLRAVAFESGFTDSAIASATYTIGTGGGTVAMPTLSPGGGTYSSVQTVTISTTTSGASIRYTLDGSTPSETAGTLYSGPVNISSTETLKAVAYESGMTDSTVVSASYTISAVNRSLTGASGDGFHALALSTAQAGTFTATFDATPSISPENSVVGLSKGAATAYTGIACIARFNPTGDIDAYNGTAYAAASTIPYSAGVTYHFRMVVNAAANTYSVYVTPAGGSELTVGLNYVFRAAATSLDTWDLDVNATPAGCSLSASNLTP